MARDSQSLGPEPEHVPGLTYVSDHDPGIRRERSKLGFDYRHPDGEPVSDPGTLDRIRALAIPPAYTDV
jgi:DNA topoisomerase-1